MRERSPRQKHSPERIKEMKEHARELITLDYPDEVRRTKIAKGVNILVKMNKSATSGDRSYEGIFEERRRGTERLIKLFDKKKF